MPMVPEATLDGVLSRIRAGDDDPDLRDRVDRVFAKHHERLRQLIARELRGFPDQDVEETLQEVLAVAWRKLATHDGRFFRAWLFGIASRRCANVRRKRRELATDDDALFDAHSTAATAYGDLRREEREALFLEAAGAVLEPREQEVLYMRYELDLPRDEIARLASLEDADAVRVILQRSRRRLTAELEARLAALGHGRSFVLDD